MRGSGLLPNPIEDTSVAPLTLKDLACHPTAPLVRVSPEIKKERGYQSS